MRLIIDHQTRYHYADVVRRSTQYLRLTPHSTARQQILSWELELPGEATCTTDGYGNILHVLSLESPHEGILIRAHGEVEICDDAPEDEESSLISPLSYLRPTPLTRPTPALQDLAKACLPEEPTLADLQSLMARILVLMPYQPGSTDATFSADEALASGSGVCQDHTHVFLTCCRHAGLPARYVSGYLYSQDNSHVAMHAWAEVWIEERWHTFDVTNLTSSTSEHLKLAVGMDYLDACPVRGVRYGGGYEQLQSQAQVTRLDGQQQ
ncbi:transglutaminase family protein [Aeromonas caviae]|uniref:transglutaminase family protein n=1 Tax=Aeromonas caviae TaxID=648 RepID=UPI0029D43A1D|nr:transglutaminase family protein [Aeromonas caviae]MDX7783111.1 transglutaminase family protein [Aeromonas caviae]MDX7890041.1 transglutaminase family protein [Aeromonas caviae]MDY7763481.1 transglutaminase family protein [Aeromonas caviae]